MNRLLALTAMVTVFASCSRDAPPTPVSSGASATPRVVPPSPPSTAQAVDALDRIDGRTPVPLLPMMANHQKQSMRDHLVAVQEIVGAVAKQDFVAVEKSAGRIGFSEQMGAVCTHMGAGAPGFAEQALNFHHTADEIGVAAKARDAGAVLAALSETLTTCTTCHQTFRQQVVDDATWAKATNMTAPAGPMHH